MCLASAALPQACPLACLVCLLRVSAALRKEKTGCKKHARAGKTSRDCRVRIKEAREKGKLHGLLLPS